MTLQRVRTPDLAAFERFAQSFARELIAGDVVALVGPLGAGKTTFIAAAVRAIQGSEAVTSPTFTFRHFYAGPPPVEHLDLYRIEDPREAIELGLDDAFDGGAIVFVEWPDRLPRLLPPQAVRVTIAGSGVAPREIAVERP